MKLREAWRLSKRPYVEITYKSTQLSRGGPGQRFGGYRDPRRQVAQVIRSARISKVIFACLIGASSIYPFVLFVGNRTPVILAAAVTFSLAITFAYIILYSLQVLPAFSGGEPFVLLSTLPLDGGDFSMIAMLSFLRTFDYVIVASIVGQVLGVGLVTGSVAAAGVMAVASLINTTFGITVALWMSRLFYRNVTRGGKSTGAAIGRVVFTLTWGLAAMSAGFLFSFVSYLLPVIEGVLSAGLAKSSIAALLSVIHPFSVGLVVAGVVFSQFLGSASSGLPGGPALVLAAVVLYGCLAIVAGRRTLGVIMDVARSQSFGAVRHITKEFAVRVRRPVYAYVIKDLRVASKLPSTASIFALPVIEIIIIGLNTSGVSLFRATSVLTATGIGCFFSLFSSGVLLATEGTGLDYTLSLPLGSSVIVNAKSVVATLAYVPVPFAIAALTLSRGNTSDLLTIIPFVQILAVSTATTAQLSFFIRGYSRREGQRGRGGLETSGFSLMSGGDLIRMAEAIVVAAVLIGAPMVAYTAAFYVSGGHLVPLGAMIVTAAAEFAGIQAYVSRR